MHKRSRKASNLVVRELLKIVAAALITLVLIVAFSAMSRLSYLAKADTEVGQDTKEATLSAVIPEDNSHEIKIAVVGVAIVLLLPLSLYLLLHWIRGNEQQSKRRNYDPKSEMTFKTISKRELGQKRVVAPRRI